MSSFHPSIHAVHQYRLTTIGRQTEVLIQEGAAQRVHGLPLNMVKSIMHFGMFRGLYATTEKFWICKDLEHRYSAISNNLQGCS